tara:strand:- start:1479 stop:2321 length:843 start_codon:yes stop_codon:yes gene_type:complete
MSNKDLIQQYVSTGAILPEYQVGKLPSNNLKSYLRRRLIGAENNGDKLLDYELFKLSESGQKKYINSLNIYDIIILKDNTKEKNKLLKLISNKKGIKIDVLLSLLNLFESNIDDIPQKNIDNIILKLSLDDIINISLSKETDRLVKSLYTNDNKQLHTVNDLVKLITSQENLYTKVEHDYNFNYGNMLNMIEKYYDNNWVNKMNDISNSIKFDLIDAYNKSGFTYYDSEDENGRKVKIRENNLLKKLGWNDYHTEHAELLDDNQIKKVILMNNKGFVKYV